MKTNKEKNKKLPVLNSLRKDSTMRKKITKETSSRFVKHVTTGYLDLF